MIYTIGETVFDIIFFKNKPIKAIAGGSMLNSSISLARLKNKVSFISEIGNDLAGGIIRKFLLDNNIDINHIYFYDDGNTIISLAFLDSDNNATYNFYKKYSKNRLKIKIPDFYNDYLMFGSFFSLDLQIYNTLFDILTRAKKNKCLLFFDPNFRKTHIKDLKKIFYNLLLNIIMSDVIKMSDEDFYTIFSNISNDVLEHNRIYSYFLDYFFRSNFVNNKDNGFKIKLKKIIKRLSYNLIMLKENIVKNKFYTFDIKTELFNSFYQNILTNLSSISVLLDAIHENMYNTNFYFMNKILIITNGSDPVLAFYTDVTLKSKILRVEVEKINPLSTIGAGDTFNAGLINGFVNRKIDKISMYNIEKLYSKRAKDKNITFENTLIEIIKEANKCAAEVCESYENYVPENFTL